MVCGMASERRAEASRMSKTGRHAVITGGASGIGFAIAAHLLREGASLSLWDASATNITAALAAFKGDPRVSGMVMDVSEPASVERALGETLALHPRVDILVNNAGITGPNVRTWEYPPEEWRRVIDIDLSGVFYCARAVVPVMLKADYGRIVNIASIAGKEGNPNAPAYSAAKAGVIGLTKSLGKELATSGIRVNCVTPAVVKTPIFEQMTQAHIDYMLAKIPMGRFGEAEEVAALVAWLCSDECTFSTGAVFDISGGRATY